jgi:3-hydroxybutyrate dehydrogenase
MKKRTALITGSTSGIGLGMAHALGHAGHDLVLNGFGDGVEISALVKKLGDATGASVIHHGADMTKPDEIAAMIAAAEQRFGHIDVLVNNAGIQHVDAIEDFPPEKWDQIIAINLVSSFHTIRHVMGGMKQRGFGRIIQLASAHALVASPFKSAYVAAKHGIAGLTKTVALEGAKQGVTCNAICPGYVLTPLVQKQIPDQARTRGLTEEQVVNDVLLAAQPTKRFVTVEEVGALAAFLASDAAGSITGAIIPIDGGWSAQ